MASYEGFDEIRLLIAPDEDQLGNGVGRLLSLRHPKSGNATCYLLVNNSLREIHWFKQPYTSWFIGDYVAEDGRLYTATPVDPVFILLPIFDKARMKKGDDDLGMFRQLDEIMLVDGYLAYEQLMFVAESFMQIVCEVKEVGSSKFFRLDDSKVLSWLYHKVCQLKQTLLTLDKNYTAQDEKNTLCEAVLILSEYLNDDPWLKQLCSHLRIDLSDVTRKASEIEFVPNSSESGLGSTVSQEKNKSNSKTSKAAKQSSNNKKVKVETASQSIKDMFTRASRRQN